MRLRDPSRRVLRVAKGTETVLSGDLLAVDGMNGFQEEDVWFHVVGGGERLLRACTQFRF